MTDKEKLIKIKSLAGKMYDAAFNLTTDASLLRKAMDDYHQFIINEYHKEEPVSEEWIEELRAKLDSMSKEDFKKIFDKYAIDFKEESASEELSDVAITAADEDMQGRQIMEESNENRQLYSRIFRRGFKAGAKWQKEQMIARAIDGIARPDDNEIWCNLSTFNFKDGDKCKVILIKEDRI